MPFKIVYEDITKIKVDALVNSTNHHMMGFSGVDEVIHELGGDKFNVECQKHVDELRYGEALYTNAGGRLLCKYVIHTYAPFFKGGLKGEFALLKSCYRDSLKIADDLGCKSVVFPLIGAGSMGYPISEAFGIATSTINEYLNLTGSKLKVILAIYGITEQSIKEFKIDGLDEYLYKNEHEILEEDHGQYVHNSKCVKLRLDDQDFVSGEAFNDVLMRFIDERQMKDSEVYNCIQMPKSTFNRIINGQVKSPKRENVYGFAIALKLNLSETEKLMQSAGLTFSNDTLDLIMKFCIENGIYKLYDINTALIKWHTNPLFTG